VNAALPVHPAQDNANTNASTNFNKKQQYKDKLYKATISYCTAAPIPILYHVTDVSKSIFVDITSL